MTKFDANNHVLIYEDDCMISFWEEHEGGVIAIYQNERELGYDNVVFVELEELRNIINMCGN